MKHAFMRVAAGMMSLLLVTTNVGSITQVYAKEGLTARLIAKQEKVLTVTQNMVAENGKLTITGEWNFIVVPKEIEVSEIYFVNVKADSIEIESGMQSKIEMVSGEIGSVNIVPAKLTKISANDLCEIIKQPGGSATAIKLYSDVQEMNQNYLSCNPTVVTRQGVSIAEVSVSGNAKLDFDKGNIKKVKVEADGSQKELTVDISNYSGNLSISQNDREDGEWLIARVNLKHSNIDNLVTDGEGQGNIVLNGMNSEVKEVKIENSPMITLDVPTEKVEIGEEATDAKLNVLTNVKKVIVEADNAKVEVAACANVRDAKVEGNNVNISGNGDLKAVEINGKGVSVSTSGTKVDGVNNYVPPVVVTPSPTPEIPPTEEPDIPPVEDPVVPPTEEVRDLGGLQIIIGDWYSPETPSEPTTSEEIARQKYREEMMEKYNFTIKQVKVANWGEMTDTYQASITLGNPVAQVFILEPRFLGGGRDLFYNLSTLSELDFGEDKWNDAVREQMTFGDGIYGMSAEKSEVRGGVFFNKRLFKEAGLDPELPYDLQKSGEWTWSKFMEICAKLTRDTDGDGKTDVYATGSYGTSTLQQLILSTGTELISYENGKYVNNLGSEKVKTAIDFANELVDAGYEMPQPEYSSWNWFEPAFAGGLVAMQFNEEYMAQPQYSYGQLEDEIGFVCCPKPDGADSYHSYFYDNVAVIPACYDAQTAADIAFAYNLWTNPASGYEEGEDSWKKQYQVHNIDERAINETMEIIFEEGVSAGLHSYLLEEEKDGALSGGLYWSWPFVNETTEEVIARLMPIWDAAVAKANEKTKLDVVAPRPDGSGSGLDSCPFILKVKEDGTIRINGLRDKSVSELVIPTELFGRKVTEIGEYAFSNASFSSVSIPDGITRLGRYAFYGCSNLKSVVIPASVTSFGDDLFLGCNDDVEIITQKGFYAEKFAKANNLPVKILEGAVPAEPPTVVEMKTIFRYNLNADNTVTITGASISSGKKLTIPSELYWKKVTKIDDCAFMFYRSLPEVTVDGVETIGANAFVGDAGLATVTLGEGVKHIGLAAFSGCTNLSKITLPNTLIEIDNYAFCDCSSLTEIVIPESVSVIGGDAFRNCVNLTIVTKQGSYAEAYAREHGISVRYMGLEKLTLTITEAGCHESFRKEYPDPENPDVTCVIDFGKGISGTFTYSRELTQEELENWWHGGDLCDADGKCLVWGEDYEDDLILWSDPSGVFAVQLPQNLKAGTYSYVLYQTINGQNVSDSYTFTVD